MTLNRSNDPTQFCRLIKVYFVFDIFDILSLHILRYLVYKKKTNEISTKESISRASENNQV